MTLGKLTLGTIFLMYLTAAFNSQRLGWVKIRDFGQHNFSIPVLATTLAAVSPRSPVGPKYGRPSRSADARVLALCREVGIYHDHTRSERSQAGDQILNQIGHLYRDAITTIQP